MQDHRYYCVLGGTNSGIYSARPNFLARPNSFPIVVTCTTHQEAEDVYKFQGAIGELNQSQETYAMLASLVQLPEGEAVLRNITKFYAVLIGMPAGIYLSYDNIQWLFSTTRTRKLKKLDTFLDAITYMFTDGHFHTAVTFLDYYRNQAGTTSTGCSPVDLISRAPPPSPIKNCGATDKAMNGSVGILAQPKIPSSSSSVPSAIIPIYQHIRSLEGVIKSLPRRPAIISEDINSIASIASLGPMANKYLAAHGYNISAIHHIEHAVSSSNDLQDFIGYLHPRGMPWTEIIYLWELIQVDVDV